MTDPVLPVSSSAAASNQKISWSLRGQWLLAVIVFTVLPYLLVCFYLGRSWEQELDDEEQRLALQMETTLMMMTQKVFSPALYLGEALEKIWRNLPRFAPGTEQQFASSVTAHLQKAFPGFFRLTFLDREFRPLLPLPPGSPALEDVQAFARLLPLPGSFKGRKAVENAIQLFQQNADLCERLLGTLADHRFLLPSRSTFFGRARQTGPFPHVLVARHHDLTLIGEYADPGPQDQRVFRHFLARFGRGIARRGWQVGLVAHAASTEIPPFVRGALSALGQSSSLCRRFGDEMVAISSLAEPRYLWISCPLHERRDAIGIRRLRLASCTFLIGVWAMLLLRFMREPERWYPSLRLRLIALFLFACGFPLMAVGLAGLDYLYEKRIVLRNQAWEDLSSRLVHFDRSLREENRLLARSIRRATRDFGNLKRSELEPRIDLLIRTIGGGNAFVFDAEGRLVAKGATVFSPTELLALGSLAKRLAGELNRSTMSGIDPAGLILGSVGKEHEMIGTFLRNLDEFQDWDLGGDRNFLMFSPLRSGDGKTCNGFLTIHLPDNERFCIYARQRLFRHSRHLPGTVLLAHHQNYDGWLPGLPSRWSRFSPTLERLSHLVDFRGRTVQVRVRGRDEVLLSAIRSPTLPMVTYFALHRGTAIDEAISGLERNLAWLLVFSLLFSGALGVHLSRRLLVPLASFKEGVNAIPKGDFRFRLPPGNPDEFGFLSESFNQAMDNLADLDLGRILQEHLFPTGVYQAHEYRITGKSLFASQLGGDIFDIRPLPGGQVLILIGDVTGHGLGAALVMAMARGLVCRLGTGEVSPAEILTAIHEVLFKTLKRKRMMTCCIALLDPSTHRLEIANAGHCAPIRVRPGRPAELLITASKPLGSWKTIQPAVRTLEIEPDEKLLFYTDGAIEAVDFDGHQIGFERLAKRVESIGSGDPAQEIERLYQWLHLTAGPGLQADDVTCVVIHRSIDARPPSRIDA